MKALVLHEWGGPLKLEDVPIPKVGPGEALVKVEACGVGLTLNWIRQGAMGGSVPRIIGHEVAGEVVEVGDHVDNVKAGDRVCVYFYLTCGICEFCRKDRETLCRNFGGYVGVTIDGGYAEYMKLPAQNLIPIPDEISYVDASIIPDAVGTPLHALRERARVRPLDTVMVVGAGGGVGIHAVQMARLCGAWVIAVDTSDEKLAKCKELGADAVINAAALDFADEARKLTGGTGVDAILDFVCTNDALAKDVRSLDRGGTMVCLAAGRPDKAVLSVPPGTMVANEFTFTGSRQVTKQELIETLEMVRLGRIKPVVTRTLPFEEAEQAHRLIQDRELIGRAVLVL